MSLPPGSGRMLPGLEESIVGIGRLLKLDVGLGISHGQPATTGAGR